MTMLNPRLLARQRMTDADEERVVTLHRMREVLFEFESTLSPDDEDDRPVFKQIPAILEQLEFAMQRGWKFEDGENRRKHTWWNQMSHCTCPNRGDTTITMDMSCPLHGRDQ